jgi:hypothetical protein
MRDISESLRLPSPAPRPQSLAYDGDVLWMGSIETSRIYAIDPKQWTVSDETQAPGKPWGITVLGDELRVILGEGSDDDRYIRRLVPGHGFKDRALRCPDDTGSQLSYDGTYLYVSQWYNRRILGLDEDGNVIRTIELPRGICGQVYADGGWFCITTDDEATDAYFLTRVTVNGTQKTEDLARIPFAARSLAFDGTRFWTNHREENQIVAFNVAP